MIFGKNFLVKVVLTQKATSSNQLEQANRLRFGKIFCDSETRSGTDARMTALSDRPNAICKRLLLKAYYQAMNGVRSVQ